uniref:MLV-related proviral Env polyprotein-like n=1 Tax=Monodelphis domestica TaxID=13616 RepID=A0A5F8G426_MONDO
MGKGGWGGAMLGLVLWGFLEISLPFQVIQYWWVISRTRDGKELIGDRPTWEEKTPQILFDLCNLFGSEWTDPSQTHAQPHRKLYLSEAPVYACPSTGPPSCKSGREFYCAAWGCGTVAQWQQEDPDIILQRERSRAWDIPLDFRNPLSLTIKNPKDKRWLLGWTWGLRLEVRGQDPGIEFTKCNPHWSARTERSLWDWGQEPTPTVSAPGQPFETALKCPHRERSLLTMLTTVFLDLSELEMSVNFLEKSLSSLVEMVLQNRQGLDLLFFKQGGLCVALGESSCFYANHSGIIQESLALLREGPRLMLNPATGTPVFPLVSMANYFDHGCGRTTHISNSGPLDRTLPDQPFYDLYPSASSGY